MKRQLINIHCRNKEEKDFIRMFAKKKGYKSLSAYVMTLIKRDILHHKL